MSARPRYVAHMNLEAVAASTPYVLVDLSDTTNFPHTFTNEIHVLAVQLSIEQKSDGAFDIYLGVVTENDATDGTAKYFYGIHSEGVSNPTDSSGGQHEEIDFSLGGFNPEGVNIAVASGATPFLVSSHTLADDAAWQNDVNRTSPAGATTKVGVGDLVMYLEEVTDGGSLDIAATVIYETA